MLFKGVIKPSHKIAANMLILCGAYAIGDFNDRARRVDDEKIRNRLRYKLATHGIQLSDIVVDVDNGRVTLSGDLPSATDVIKARRAANAIHGVLGVDTTSLRAA